MRNQELISIIKKAKADIEAILADLESDLEELIQEQHDQGYIEAEMAASK